MNVRATHSGDDDRSVAIVEIARLLRAAYGTEGKLAAFGEMSSERLSTPNLYMTAAALRLYRATELSPMGRPLVSEWLHSLMVVEGGYRDGSHETATLQSTNAAVASLCILGEQPRDVQGLVAFLESRLSDNGSFRDIGRPVDEYGYDSLSSFQAMRVLSCLESESARTLYREGAAAISRIVEVMSRDNLSGVQAVRFTMATLIVAETNPRLIEAPAWTKLEESVMESLTSDHPDLTVVMYALDALDRREGGLQPRVIEGVKNLINNSLIEGVATLERNGYDARGWQVDYIAAATQLIRREDPTWRPDVMLDYLDVFRSDRGWSNNVIVPFRTSATVAANTMLREWSIEDSWNVGSDAYIDFVLGLAASGSDEATMGELVYLASGVRDLSSDENQLAEDIATAAGSRLESLAVRGDIPRFEVLWYAAVMRRLHQPSSRDYVDELVDVLLKMPSSALFSVGDIGKIVDVQAVTGYSRWSTKQIEEGVEQLLGREGGYGSDPTAPVSDLMSTRQALEILEELGASLTNEQCEMHSSYLDSTFGRWGFSRLPRPITERAEDRQSDWPSIESNGDGVVVGRLLSELGCIREPVRGDESDRAFFPDLP